MKQKNKTREQPEKRWKKSEVAERFGVSTKTVERWEKQGLKAKRINGRPYYPESAIVEFENKMDKEAS